MRNSSLLFCKDSRDQCCGHENQNYRELEFRNDYVNVVFILVVVYCFVVGVIVCYDLVLHVGACFKAWNLSLVSVIGDFFFIVVFVHV